jgi:hypothetical protein
VNIFELFANARDVVCKLSIDAKSGLDTLDRMKHGGVIPTGKGTTDLGKALRRQPLGEIHRHVARSRELASMALSQYFIRRDTELQRSRAQDVDDAV